MDFIDFGFSNGGSLLLDKNWFDGKEGLSIDIDDNKIKTAISKCRRIVYLKSFNYIE